MTELSKFHPLDPEDMRSPYGPLDELREQCPVAHLDRPGQEPAVLVTRYDDATKVYRSTSISGGVQRRTDGRSDSAAGGYDIADATVLGMRGSEHARVRRIVMAAVTPKAVNDAVPFIEAMSRAVVAEMPSDGRVELKAMWASDIPSRVIAHVLGVPDDDYEQFLAWTQNKMKAVYAMSVGLKGWEEDFRRSEDAFREYMQAQIDRRREPGAPDDALTRMIEAEDSEGHKLDDGVIITNAIFLLNAGNQTTQHLLCNTVTSLIGEPGLYQQVREDRSLVESAIEESLRIAPPIMYATRVLEHDVELTDCVAKTGDSVIISNYAANRDPRAFGDDASEYTVDRKQETRHLGFALGPHACFGAALARTVSRVALNALLDRYSSITMAPDFVFERMDFWTSNGPKHLEVDLMTDPGWE